MWVGHGASVERAVAQHHPQVVTRVAPRAHLQPALELVEGKGDESACVQTVRCRCGVQSDGRQTARCRRRAELHTVCSDSSSTDHGGPVLGRSCWVDDYSMVATRPAALLPPPSQP